MKLFKELKINDYSLLIGIHKLKDGKEGNKIESKWDEKGQLNEKVK